MRARRVNFNNVSTKVVLFDGGLNENSSSLELKGGELRNVNNYEILEGSQSGYTSIQGYERYDGQATASSIPVVIVDSVVTDDTAREAQRALILEVPGEGPVLGVHIYKSTLYAFRNATGGATAKMYVESATGWVEVNTSGSPLLPDGDYSFVNHNFFAGVETLSMYWTDTLNQARVFDGTTVTVIDNINQSGVGKDYPINLAAHNDRLFLAYELGFLQASTLGDPTDWTALTVEELSMGREITELSATVGNALVIYCDEAIKVLKGTADRDTWTLETFSDVSGSYPHTVNRMFGTMFFMDDRGVTSLAAVQEYGDFATNSISTKVHRTLQNFKAITSSSTVSRDKNQYRLFFTSGLGMYFSFYNKKLVGTTLVNFDNPVIYTTEGEDSEGTNIIYFTSTDGYVYKMDSGTSFDGAEIPTRIATAFYHYGSPRNWKRFHSATVEVSANQSVDLSIRTLFDYGEGFLPKSATVQASVAGFGGVYGDGKYGEIVYGSNQGTARLRHYIHGLGSNMSLELNSLSKYNTPHVLNNLITDYEVDGRQL